MPVELEPEQRAALVEAQEYTELINSPGWKRIWAFGEDRVRQSLSTMKNSKSCDPVVLAALQIIWRERELFMDAIHTEIKSKIEQKREVLEEVALSLGATEDQLQEVLDREEMYGR